MDSDSVRKRARGTLFSMGKYVLALVIVVAGVGLFFYANATSPVASEPPSQTPTTGPFGEGSTTVGSFDEATSTPATGVISRSELKKHNQQADCWVAYKGLVYDITSWLPRHPGSAGAIAPYCGTAEEFAEAFTGQHGTSKESRLQKEGVKEGTLEN